MTQPKFLPRLMIAAMVSIGVAVVWGFAAAWLLNLWEVTFTPQASGYERIFVDRTGRPLILASTYTPVPSETFHTLDGQPVEGKKARTGELYPAQLPDPAKATWKNIPEPWTARLLQASNLREFPGSASWYLIKTGEQMYLEGFDDASRMSIGFIGRKGFRTSLPDRSEWFTIRGTMTTQVAGLSINQQGPASYLTDSVNSILPWRLYVIDANRIVEIDLREHTVKTLLDGVDAMSIGILWRAVDAPLESNAEGNAEGQNVQGLEHRLVVRLPDRVRFLQPETGKIDDFELPEPIRSQNSIAVHGVPGEDLLIQLGEPFYALARQVELVRIDRSGRELEKHTVDLAGWVPKTDRRIASEGVVIGPMPLGWAIFAGVLKPFNELEEGHGATFGEALSEFIAKIWPAMVVVAIIGGSSALVVYRRQVQYHRDHTFGWSLAALLLGPAFVIAYFIEHRDDAFASCPACGRAVPRSRETCAACGGEFPAPALLGTEVFA